MSLKKYIAETYFQGLVFTKVERHQSGFVIYAARVQNNESGYHYVYALVPHHLAIKDRAHLSQLSWSSVQTRKTSEPKYRLPLQKWELGRNAPQKDVLMEVRDRNPKYSSYATSPSNFSTPDKIWPIELQLLNTDKKKDCSGQQCSIYQYNNKMYLADCINTFHCVIISREEETHQPSVRTSSVYGEIETRV